MQFGKDITKELNLDLNNLEAATFERVDDIAVILTNQVKMSITRELFARLETSMDKTITTLENYGHLGSVDLMLCLEKAMLQKKIKPDQKVLLVSSGLGFTWACSALLF